MMQVAACLFPVMPPPQAGKALRKAFPHLHLFVMGSAAAGAVLARFLAPAGGA